MRKGVRCEMGILDSRSKHTGLQALLNVHLRLAYLSIAELCRMKGAKVPTLGSHGTEPCPVIDRPWVRKDCIAQR